MESRSQSERRKNKMENSHFIFTSVIEDKMEECRIKNLKGK
jgi:hypothetical protein